MNQNVDQNWILLLPVLFPVLAGILIACVKGFKNRRVRLWYVIAVTLLELVLVFAAAAMGGELELFRMTQRLVFRLRPDRLTILFGGLCAVMWFLASVYSADYLQHDKGERFYQIFFLCSEGVIAALCFAGNLVTMYLFYEMMTLLLVPLVLHEGSREAIRAGMEFLLYSVGGAFLGLAGFFIFYACGIDMEFTVGGVREAVNALGAQDKNLVLLGAFLAIVGFGSKAGLFPLHGWLPVAHPVAPAPASALLSGNVTKMGVLLILRIIYYVLGADFLRGTWVQYTLLAFALITVLMGSVIASREKLLKRRLAYSTVSQVSYALFGIFVMHPVALAGALMHVVFHSAVKNTLFLSAGAIIHQTGCTRVDELKGIGKKMPVTMWLYTFASLTLVGIPPTSAFLSKWYLAQGALSSEIPVVCISGPVILLVSAVFTAAYLLSVTVNGFLPGRDEQGELLKYEKKEASLWILLPMLVLTAAAVGFGMFPGALVDFVQTICGAVL